MLDIIITANSPGEVAAWVKPVVWELKRYYPESKITVFLPPCVFASGSEKRVLQEYQKIDRIYERREYLKYILLKKKLTDFSPGKEGIVIFLGGDLFHAVMLGKRLDYPIVAYTEGVYNWGNQIGKFMVPDERTRTKLIKRGSPADKVDIIGNLMLDAIKVELNPEETRHFLQIRDEFVVTLFPGSRPAEVEYMLPFFLDAISDLFKTNLQKELKFSFLLSLSPFIEVERLQEIFQHYITKNELYGQYIKGEKYDLIQLGKQLEVKILTAQQYSIMQITNLALTIPGTNNLELAYFGTPMLVLLPLNKPEDIPLEGIPGLLGKVPLVGPALKRVLVPKIAEKMEFVALINIIAQEKIVPEVKGILKPDVLTREIELLLSNRKRLQEISNKLKDAVGEKGAVQKLRQIVTETLASYH